MFSWLGDSLMSGWKSLGYNRLPQQPLRLSVLKLDGSCFEVQVARTATVAELKEAVEEVFSLLPSERDADISWSLVWGYFCLSYKGQKLVDDKALVRLLGIRDEDQLCFVRHLSISYVEEERPIKQQSVHINSMCLEMVDTIIPEDL